MWRPARSRSPSDLDLKWYIPSIQEEVDKGTLKLCAFTFVYRETCTCDFYTQIEINQVVFFSQFPMRKRIFRKFCFHAPHLFYDIVFCSYTFRYTVIRNIGDRVEHVLHFCCSLCHDSIQFFVTFFQFGNAGTCRFSLFFLAFFHQLSDSTRKRVDLCQVFI